MMWAMIALFATNLMWTILLWSGRLRWTQKDDRPDYARCPITRALRTLPPIQPTEQVPIPLHEAMAIH